MSKNNYWVLLLKGEEPKLFTSWPECEEKTRGASRAVWKGFPTKDEAMEFIDGKWRGNPISEKAKTWIEEYKTKEEQLKQDMELDTSAISLEELPKYCAYVDGSYDPRSKTYGFGIVFIGDGKIEKFYGGGKEKVLVDMGCGAGELLACIEAIKHAKTLGWSELTIIYDSELISWAYRGCGEKMLTQAAGQYMYDIREKIKIEVKSINGVSHTSEEDPGITLADKLARKGVGIVD